LLSINRPANFKIENAIRPTSVYDLCQANSKGPNTTVE
jgi:hypothetical protein